MDEAATVSLTYSIYSILCEPYPQFPSSKCPDNHSLMGMPHIRKHWFRNGLQRAEVLHMCLIFRSSVSRSVSLVFLIKTIRFQLQWIVENRQFKGGINLETKLLKIRQMSRPKLFYLGPPVSNLKPAFSDVCGLQHERFVI